MTSRPAPTCAAILQRISAYLDQELDRETCRAIEEHCADCPACADLVEGLRKTIGLCRASAESPLPDDVKARARQSIERLLSRPPSD
ncbi:MAG TPA: zf-HC2 domain-containing protein [Vicinamibacterales bacterium]|nr:zf-HC2 domain-containing protein [Vicinamibacterales bacterium]